MNGSFKSDDSSERGGKQQPRKARRNQHHVPPLRTGSVWEGVHRSEGDARF
jgi:hypothetical protein